MEKRKCPDCQKQIEVSETEGNGVLVFLPHRRWKPYSEEETEQRVHARNIVDQICPGSNTIA